MWKLAVILSLVGLIRSEDHDGIGDTCARVTTFNAGLIPRVPEYETRKPLVPDALLAEDADVLCLQEYWFERDMQEMINNLSAVYRYHYSFLHHKIGMVRDSSSTSIPTTGPDSPCSSEDVTQFTTRLLPCAALNGCLAVFANSSLAGAACILQNCGVFVRDGSIAPDCISCLILSTLKIPPASLELCRNSDPLATHNRWNRYGLVLLSKKKMNSASVTSYFPGRNMSVARGYLEADIQDLGKVVCTHFTAYFDNYFEYDLDFGSYDVQQANEINVTINTFGGTDHILLGDLNMGPGVDSADPQKNLTEMMGPNYQTLIDSGYQDPYINQDGRCTHCKSNSLGSNSHDVGIDHVLLSGNTFLTATARRTLDVTGNGTLSDHYGVRSTLCKAT